jgi:hypothetical protein
MDEPPLLPRPPAVPPRKLNPRQVAYGFVTGLGIFGLAYLPPPGPGYNNALPFLLAITLLPLAAIVLSVIRPTRNFGLGMLLACGVLWLVMLAICGGMFRSIPKR